MKLVVTVVLALVLVESVTYALASRQFERLERDDAEVSAESMLVSMAARLDDRFTEWRLDTSGRLLTIDPEDPVPEVLSLREEGFAGAAYFARGATGPTALSLNEHAAQSSMAILPVLGALPAGITVEDGHIFTVALDEGRGTRMVAWREWDVVHDVLASDEVELMPREEVAAAPGAVSVPLASAPYALVARIDEAAVLAEAAANSRSFLVASAAALAVTGGLVVLIIGRTLAPLRDITEAARRMGRPDEPPPKLRVDTGDEMQVLAETIVASSRALAEGRERERAQAEALRHAEIDRALLDAALAIERRDEDNRRVLDSLTECVLVLDRSGEVVYANAAGRAHGFAVAAPVGKTLDAQGAAALVERVREAKLAASPPLRVVTAAHRLLDAEARAIGFDGRDAVLVVATDVTEREWLASEADARRAALARSERLSALGTLVAGVAHEINNPLTYINGNLELALLELEDEEVDRAEARRRLAAALSGTERIAHITRALRAVARQGRPGVQEMVDLGAVAQNVAALVRVGLPPDVHLDVEVSAHPAVVAGSSTELHQVLLNLAKNAVEAVGERGRVLLRCAPVDREAHLEVRDDGPGIPEEVVDRLFTPFFTTKPDGTGLGLSIVQGIVRDHGGRVEVRSTPGKGTSFRVTLPLAPLGGAKASPTPLATRSYRETDGRHG